MQGGWENWVGKRGSNAPANLCSLIPSCQDGRLNSEKNECKT